MINCKRPVPPNDDLQKSGKEGKGGERGEEGGEEIRAGGSKVVQEVLAHLKKTPYFAELFY